MAEQVERIIEYKGYQVKPAKNMPSHLTIVTAGRGGKIPNVLDGMFTSHAIARKSIDAYLESKEK